jgi:hypothetical protein
VLLLSKLSKIFRLYLAAHFLIGSAKVGALNYSAKFFLRFFSPEIILTFRRTSAFFEAGCKYRTGFPFQPKFYRAELCTYDENQACSGFQQAKKFKPFVSLLHHAGFSAMKLPLGN